MHCPPPPTLEVLESVLAKRGLGLRRELVTPSVRTQQCSLSRDQRRCATCAMRAALAVCERFQHESSSPCYRSSGGWVECSRLSESAASCGATSSADTTSSSPGSRYRAREARRSSARSLRFVGRRACTPSGQPGPFQSPCLNRPVDRQAYRSCRPSSSRLPPRQTRLSNRPGGAALRCIPPSCERGTSSASRACYWQRLGYFMLEHTSATTIGGFRSQPERCNNANPGRDLKGTAFLLKPAPIMTAACPDRRRLAIVSRYGRRSSGI